MTDTAEFFKPRTLNLCFGGEGLGDGPYTDAEDLPIWFTCADKAAAPHSFPCTGSKHTMGVHITCSCSCHDFRPVTEKDREARRG